jgi:hypothetical protein
MKEYGREESWSISRYHFDSHLDELCKRNPLVRMILVSVHLVSQRTAPTKRPPLVGEVSVNFC